MADPLYLNNLATVNYGFAQGQQQQASRLAGQAFAAPPDQRKGALNQLAGVDVNAATQMQSNFQTQDDADLKKFGNAIDYMGNALKSGNQQQIQGAFQAMRPYLAEKAQAAGKDPSQLPQQWDDSMLPAFYQAQAQVGHAISGGTAESQNFANMTQGFSPEDIQKARRINVGLDPRAAQPTDPHIVTINTPQGEQQYYQTPQGLAPLKLAGQGSPAMGQPSQGLPAGAASTYAPSLPASLTDAVQHQESGGNPNAVSSAGAQGLMQLMPQTAANPGFGVQPTQDGSPQENQRVGHQYLAALTQKYGGNTQLALAAYNAGPGRVDAAMQQAGGDPTKALTLLPPETQNYVPSVMGQAGGGLGFKPNQTDNYRLATPEELVAAGLPKGSSAQIGKNGQLHVINKPNANSDEIQAPGDATKHGEEYLATIPDSMRPLVQAIARGDQAPPSASSRSPQAQALLQAVYAFDPTASASNLVTRNATRKSFTSGKDAQNMTALSQLALHLDHLNDQVGSIAGYSAPDFVNSAINSTTDKFNGKTTAFNSSADAVAHELRSVFANASGGTQSELENNLKQLSSSNSEAQKKAVVQNIAQLVHGRFAILQDKYSQGMGTTQDPFSASYPGAEDTILRLSGASASPQAQHAQVQQQQVSQQPSQAGSIPQAAIQMLKQNPSLRTQFEQKYGQGASASVLGQ